MCGLYIHLAILVGERSSPFIYCVMRISKDEKLKHKMIFSDNKTIAKVY